MLPPKGPEVAVEMCCRPGGETATHPIMGRSGSVTSCKRLRAGTGSPAGARSGAWSLMVPASTSMSQNERSASSGKSRRVVELDHVGRKRRRAEAPRPRDLPPVKRDHERVAGLGARNRERSRLRVSAHRNGLAVPITAASIDRAGAHAVTRLHRQSRLVPAKRCCDTS